MRPTGSTIRIVYIFFEGSSSGYINNIHHQHADDPIRREERRLTGGSTKRVGFDCVSSRSIICPGVVSVALGKETLRFRGTTVPTGRISGMMPSAVRIRVVVLAMVDFLDIAD